MKIKLFITSITLSVASICSLTAQTNLNFENWTGTEPNGWYSTNPITQVAGGTQTVFKETTNPGQGTSSVKMKTGSCPDCANFTIFGFSTPLPNPMGGQIQLGTFEASGIAYSQRPISVDFKYKSKPLGNDAGGVHIELTKYDAVSDEDVIIGEAYFEANTEVANWTNINIPVVYYSNLTPDRMEIYATSSIGSIPDLTIFGVPALPVPAPVAGSEFQLDEIVMNLPSCEGFILTASGTNETVIGANNGTATANPTGGTAPYSYAWSTGSTAQSINGLAPGLYFVTATDANQCQKVATYNVVQGGCNLSVSVTGTNSSTTSIFSGNGSATATITGGSSALEITWNTGGSTASISNLAVGSYAVLVVEQNNPLCAVWGYHTVYGPAGSQASVIENSSETKQVEIFPNPSKGKFTVKSDSVISSIVITNLIGEKVYSENVNSSKIDVNLEKHPKGIYFYQIKTDKNNSETGKISID